VVFNSDNTQIISGSWDRTIKIWDIKTCTCIETLIGHTGDVNQVIINKAGTRIISSSYDHTIKIWDATTYQLITTLYGHNEGVLTVVFDTDEKKHYIWFM
jgi:WD40 repeat protein